MFIIDFHNINIREYEANYKVFIILMLSMIIGEYNTNDTEKWYH